MTKIVETTRKIIQDLFKCSDSENICAVPTSRGLEAIIDSKFANKVGAHRWFAVISSADHIYAVADIEGRRITLQRFILSLANPGTTAADFKQVSFKNKISFDCRLGNLLEAVGRQSVMRNRKPKRNSSSQYKGVSKKQRTNGEFYWRASIKGAFGSVGLGSFEDEKSAALAYDAAASLLFEGSGYYNFPNQCCDPEALETARTRIARFMIVNAKKEQSRID